MLKRILRTPVRVALPLTILAVTPIAIHAQQPVPATEEREHVVRRGDTLWDLARVYLNNPFLWPMIYDANRNVVENAHWIYPAERLIIPGLRPPATAAAGVPEGEPIGQVYLPALETPAEAADTAPTVVTSVDLRRPVIGVGEYLRLPWISRAANGGATARIARRADAGAQADRIASALYPNDRVHIVTEAGLPAVGDTLMAIRPVRRVGDHGTIIEPLALLRVDSVAGGAAIGRVVSQFGELRVGDVVMPLAPVPAIGVGAPTPVEGGPEGQLLQFMDREAMYGTTDLGFINMGSAQGVGIGDEFAVYVSAGNGLPPTQVAVVRVVHAREHTATVRVLSVNSTALREGLPIRLISRMP